MSGTSFAAPVVSGIAASILAKNPGWTPDQVKGALMEKSAQPSGYVVPGALGIGVVNGAAAAGASGSANPNAALNAFVVGFGPSRTFDAVRVVRRRLRERVLELCVVELARRGARRRGH